MKAFRFKIYEAFLVYPPGQEVHTAASGHVAALHEIFAEIEDRQAGLIGVGEVRANIEFISGTPEADVAPRAIALLKAVADSSTHAALESGFAQARSRFPKISQAIIENTLVDLAAKRGGVTAAEILGGVWKPSVPCNQCVFWGADSAMKANFEMYLAQGFRRIKLRVGIGTTEDDVRRLQWMRERGGPEIELSIDANGAWDADMALTNIDRLRRFDIKYVEQPTHKGDWDGLERVARESGLDVMIDEGLQTDDDVARVCANKGRISAHLKIAKAGGAAALVAIGRRFDQSGVSYVMGQMNEGALATAIAVQAGMALKPRVGELYGALGILNDPGDGVTYGPGSVSVACRAGAGSSLRHDRLSLLWDSDA
ncbi:MAG: mandelate racemase/muconate lactonizing enzyme family protein [Alphaproteobacteria bacterium]|nr:mandelate racemase/muconate lactonizing enzyme family protein [Alphaproteobacteria bacterium]